MVHRRKVCPTIDLLQRKGDWIENENAVKSTNVFLTCWIWLYILWTGGITRAQIRIQYGNEDASE